VARDMEVVVNQILDEEEHEKGHVKGSLEADIGSISIGPQIWVVKTARSLVGRELKRRGRR